MLIGPGLRGERLGHEADLGIGANAAGEIGVEDPVEDRPVVDGAALLVFRVGVGGAPLERGRAVARCEQVVGAKVDLLRPQVAEFAEQLPAVRHGGVVGLFGPEETPDLRHASAIALGVDLDGHSKGCVGAAGDGGDCDRDRDEKGARCHDRDASGEAVGIGA